MKSLWQEDLESGTGRPNFEVPDNVALSGPISQTHFLEASCPDCADPADPTVIPLGVKMNHRSPGPGSVYLSRSRVASEEHILLPCLVTALFQSEIVIQVAVTLSRETKIEPVHG